MLSSASLFLWSLHGDELAPQFGMISSMLLKASFCTQGASLVLFVFACLTVKLTFPHPNQPSVLRSRKVTIVLERPAFASLSASLGAQYLKDHMRRERELCALPGEENSKLCLLSVGT